MLSDFTPSRVSTVTPVLEIVWSVTPSRVPPCSSHSDGLPSIEIRAAVRRRLSLSLSMQHRAIGLVFGDVRLALANAAVENNAPRCSCEARYVGGTEGRTFSSRSFQELSRSSAVLEFACSQLRSPNGSGKDPGAECESRGS